MNCFHLQKQTADFFQAVQLVFCGVFFNDTLLTENIRILYGSCNKWGVSLSITSPPGDLVARTRAAVASRPCIDEQPHVSIPQNKAGTPKPLQASPYALSSVDFPCICSKRYHLTHASRPLPAAANRAGPVSTTPASDSTAMISMRFSLAASSRAVTASCTGTAFSLYGWISSSTPSEHPFRAGMSNGNEMSTAVLLSREGAA